MRRTSSIILTAMALLLIVMPLMGTANATEPPSMCTNVRAAGFWDSITISGNFPDNYETCDLQGFHFYRGTDPGNLTLRYTMTLTVIPIFKIFMFQDTEIYNGVTYYYSVAAFNSDGDGPSTDVISEVCYGAPPAPQNLTCNSTCRNITLTWDIPPSDGGSPIVNYSIYKELMNEGYVFVGNVTALTFIDDDVEPGVFYNYKVCAVNDDGPGKFIIEMIVWVPMPTITGVLTYSDGTPMADAIVGLDGNTTVATTDANGTFSMEVTFGCHNLTAWLDGVEVFGSEIEPSEDLSDLGTMTTSVVLETDDTTGDGGSMTIIMLAIGALVVAAFVIVMMVVRKRK